MPAISRFLGIIISMYYRGEASHPPHFHVKYNEYDASVAIESLKVTGKLPRRVQSLVIEWATIHKAELLDNWERARKQLPLNNIEPLE